VRTIDYDPTGEHHGGIPTYPWRLAPQGLATRRQLRARRLSPGGQDSVAQIVCRRGRLIGYLYDIDKAAPAREATAAVLEALDKAMAAPQTCPTCRIRYDYCLPLKTLGSCFACSPEAQDAAA
jgi:hypothetical protein